MHRPMKRRIHERVGGFLGAKMFFDWEQKLIRSVSLWSDLESVYGMGSVPQHVAAVRVPPRLGIETSCGVFQYAGDWRGVLFGGPWQTSSPLTAR